MRIGAGPVERVSSTSSQSGQRTARQATGKIVDVLFLVLVATLALVAQEPSTAPTTPDNRYKADILLMVAHPDDEGAVTPYIARVLDEGKRVAVIYGTRGGSGSNQAGPEHAAALADIREIEARRAWAALGVSNVWFLGGKDTASQDVLASLANWGHGAALEETVRLVRLTRPEVILTFFPGVFIGENHGDHQAAGVIATEAFDLAGDPAAFASQIAGATQRLEPYLENLRPWQPKKLYYFGYGDHFAEFKSAGPSYSVLGISKTSNLPYWRVALEAFEAHDTQAKAYIESLKKMNAEQNNPVPTDAVKGWTKDQHFVLAKSLVSGAVTGDVFANINSAPQDSANQPAVAVELGGPWKFYSDFRKAHGLDRLPQIPSPEIAVAEGKTLDIPILLSNSTKGVRDIVLSAAVPGGWSVQSGAARYTIGPGETVAIRIQIALPQTAASDPPSKETQDVSINAESDGKPLNSIRLRVQLRQHALPQ
jgi:LmbE family N-acetylglucosaminyl deacetylase